MSVAGLAFVIAVAAAAASMVGSIDAAHAATDTQAESHPFTHVEYTVFPPTGDTPKAAPFEKSAGIGDRVRIVVTADMELDEYPRIYVAQVRGVLGGWNVMRPGSEPNTWTHEFTVREKDARTYDAGAYTYSYAQAGSMSFSIKTDRDMTYRQGIKPSHFGTKPPIISDHYPTVLYAGFVRPDTIHVEFSDIVTAGPTSKQITCTHYCPLVDYAKTRIAINGLSYSVTAPDGTNAPDDADSDPDDIPLLESGINSWQSSLYVKLQEPAVAGVTYTLELPDSLRDYGGNRFLDRTVDVEHTAAFTAKTVNATTTIVTFPGEAKGGMTRNSWKVTSEDTTRPIPPYTVYTYKGLSWPIHDTGSGKARFVESVTLGPPAHSPELHFDREHRIWAPTRPEGTNSPSAWWNWNVLVGIPESYAERSLTIKHYPLEGTDSKPFVSYRPPQPHYAVYIHPGTGDESSPPYIPWQHYVDFIKDNAPMLAMRAGSDVISPGITQASDAWPPTFTAWLTSSTTMAIEFSEPVSGTARITDWAIADGTTARAIQSVRAGEHTSAEGASARAASASLTAARTITLTHEALSSTASSPSVSYTRPTASATDAIADVAGNHLPTMTVTATALSKSTDAIPPTFVARTVGTDLVKITFGERVSGSVEASQWTIAGTAASSLRAMLGSTMPIASLSGATSLYLVAGPMAYDARPTVTFTPPATPTLADAAGNAVAAATVTAADGTAPIVTLASTESPSEVTVTFSEAVSGTTAAGEWRVAGSAPASLRLGDAAPSAALALSGTTEITLVTAGGLAPDSTPRVTYTPPASAGITDTVIASAPSHETATPMAAQSLVAADGIAPTIASSSAGSPTQVTVTFSEALSGTTTVDDWTVGGSAPSSLRAGAGAGTWVSQPNGSAPITLSGVSTVMLVLEAALAQGTAPSVGYSPKATAAGALADAAGNPLAPVATTPRPVVTPPTVSPPVPLTTPATFTARTVNATLVEVTFGSPVTGAVAPSQWAVAGTAATSLRAMLLSISPATSLSGATSLYLVAGPLAADSRPTVAFTPPGTPTLLDSAGNAVAAATVTAADGFAPSFSATTASATSVTVTFSEAVSGPTAAGEWAVGGTPPASLRLGASSPTVAVSASSTAELTLVMSSPLSPDATPQVRYSPVAGTAGLTDIVAPTAPAHETATPMRPHWVFAADGIAPTPAAAFAGPRAITVTFDEALAAPATIAGLAYAVTVPDGPDADVDPDAVAVSAAAYDAASRALTLTLAADAAVGVAHTVTLPASGLADAAGNAVSPAVPAVTRADAAAPTFTARTAGESLVHVTFSEPVSGAVAAAQWTVAGAAAASLRATQASAPPTTSLSGATSLFLATSGIGPDATPAVAFAPPGTPTLADAAGNAVAAASVTAADGIFPTIASAALESPTRVIVTFSEGLSGTTSVSDWTVAGSAPASMRAGAGANAWVSQPDAAAPLSLSGSGAIMLVAGSAIAGGSAPPVAYAPAAPAADPLADAAGNPLAPVTVTPDAPARPRATSVSYEVLPPTGDAPRAAPFANHARAGDRITMTLTLDSQASPAPRVTFPDATTVAMAPGAAANTWIATYTVVADAGVPDGRFSFVARFGGAEATASSFPAVPPLMDHAAPAVASAGFVRPDTIRVTFSERLAGTPSSIEGAGWTVSSLGGTLHVSSNRATYHFATGEEASIRLTLNNTHAAAVAVTATVTVTPQGGEAQVSEIP
ncbi:MAG: hypothetical protein OXU86_02995, partial [Thaumarchaeota archaeon]|nr:hypothetical protein [Nitrososphaerota archaeon]